MKRIPIPFGTAFEMGNGEIWLARLHVPPRLRGRGVGTMTVQYLQRLRKPIVLEAKADKGFARKLREFYTRLGFKPTNKLCGGMRWDP